jgi:hypothetical protein
MKKLFRRRKRATLGRAIVGDVGMVACWIGAFGAARGLVSLMLMGQPKPAVSDLIAPFSPTFAAAALLVGPLVFVGGFALKFRMTPKG